MGAETENTSDQFSGRLGLIFATIGAAIGTGNIWRFPRMVGANGAFPFSYPTVEEGGNYYELSIPYRAAFGDAVLSILMFLVIATMVWGGLGFTLREMFSEDDRILGMPEEVQPQPTTILEKGK